MHDIYHSMSPPSMKNSIDFRGFNKIKALKSFDRYTNLHGGNSFYKVEKNSNNY